ncbi:hypothetical protein ACMGDH_06585 [Sphingomonas sp. DT-207]|uniref:hypothetical protein n=1 Tax=Sphingomonas sp. DT-207 TaxID=3396167 RepID=UPI003F1B9E0C
MADKPSSPIEYACARCGGIAVTRDAWAEWNVARQRWTLCEVFDFAFCHQCARATQLVERPAGTAPPAPDPSP